MEKSDSLSSEMADLRVKNGNRLLMSSHVLNAMKIARVYHEINHKKKNYSKKKSAYNRVITI